MKFKIDKKLLISASIVLLIFGLIVGTILFFMLLRNLLKGIPAGFELYETEDYSIAYPKNWTLNETGGAIAITDNPEVVDIILGTTGPENGGTYISVNSVVEPDPSYTEFLLNGKCTDFTQRVRESGNLVEGLSLGVSGEEILELGGGKGCKYLAEITFNGVTTRTYSYQLVNSEAEDVIYQVLVNVIGDKDPDNIAEFTKSAETFKFL